MNPGDKKLANGKVLGELEQADVEAAVEKAGYEVFSAATTRSSPHVVIVTVAGRRAEAQTVAVHLYRYEDPEWRASRFKALKQEAGRALFEDGDFLVQVGARKQGAPDEEANRAVLEAIVGG